MRPWLALLVLTGVAHAHPPTEIIRPDPEVEPDPTSWRASPAILEWTTWFRLGFGVEQTPPGYLARSTEPPAPQLTTTWQTGLGAGVTLPLAGGVRIGPWFELQGLDPAIGGELLVTRAPAHFDRFFYDGEGVVSLRAGGTTTRMTGEIGWGYRCPWKLWGPYSRASRYEIGVRIVAAGSRAYANPQDWSATLGLEVEPVGAFRYLLGIRSWY